MQKQINAFDNSSHPFPQLIVATFHVEQFYVENSARGARA